MKHAGQTAHFKEDVTASLTDYTQGKMRLFENAARDWSNSYLFSEGAELPRLKTREGL
jgi:hypothetical protein